MNTSDWHPEEGLGKTGFPEDTPWERLLDLWITVWGHFAKMTGCVHSVSSEGTLASN